MIQANMLDKYFSVGSSSPSTHSFFLASPFFVVFFNYILVYFFFVVVFFSFFLSRFFPFFSFVSFF